MVLVISFSTPLIFHLNKMFLLNHRITNHGCLAGNIRVKSKKGNIKFNYQIMDSKEMPSIGNFLPYSQWPPMVKNYIKATGKTRVKLMVEEEQVHLIQTNML